jgi:hypothetical protein
MAGTMLSSLLVTILTEAVILLLYDSRNKAVANGDNLDFGLRKL